MSLNPSGNRLPDPPAAGGPTRDSTVRPAGRRAFLAHVFAKLAGRIDLRNRIPRQPLEEARSGSRNGRAARSAALRGPPDRTAPGPFAGVNSGRRLGVAPRTIAREICCILLESLKTDSGRRKGAGPRRERCATLKPGRPVRVPGVARRRRTQSFLKSRHITRNPLKSHKTARGQLLQKLGMDLGSAPCRLRTGALPAWTSRPHCSRGQSGAGRRAEAWFRGRQRLS